MIKHLSILGLAAAIPAQAVVFNPTPADLGDLDHHYAYSWGINWALPANEKIVSAEIKFKQIYDWKVEADNLYIHLLDKAQTGVDVWLENPNDVLSDFFATSTVNLNASGISQGSQYSAVSQIKIGQWTDPQGQDWQGTHAKDVTIQFTAAQLLKLTDYIKNDNRFALGFDPDCHYFNQGVSFEIKTASVPDGGTTAALLGLGVAGLALIRRKLS